jgi:hypothetical protein
MNDVSTAMMNCLSSTYFYASGKSCKHVLADKPTRMCVPSPHMHTRARMSIRVSLYCQ